MDKNGHFLGQCKNHYLTSEQKCSVMASTLVAGTLHLHLQWENPGFNSCLWHR